MKWQGKSWLDRLALTLSCLTIVWGPLAQGSTFGWGMSGLVILGCTSLATTLLAVTCRGRMQLTNPWWVGACVAFVVWVWASTGWAADKWEAFRWAGVWTALIGTILCIHIMAISRRRQMAVLLTMVITGSAALIVAYLQTQNIFISGFKHYPGTGIRLVTGPYFNPSHFSGFLIPIAAISMSLILFTRLHLHTLALLSLLLFLHAMNLKTDGSSIPAVLLATGLPFLIWTWTKRRWLGAILTAIAISTAISGVIFLTQPQGQIMFDTYKGYIGLSKDWKRFLTARQAVWRYGSEMLTDHPLYGTGIGQFESEAQLYRAPERMLKTGMDRAAVNYAHNDVLQIGSELGGIGIVLYLLILFLPFSLRGSHIGLLIWISVLISTGLSSIYDAHITAIPGTGLFVLTCCGLAAWKPLDAATKKEVPMDTRDSSA